MGEICTRCKSEITEEREVCRACYGTGESDDPLDFHGCLSCRNGEVISWHCECDYLTEEEEVGEFHEVSQMTDARGKWRTWKIKKFEDFHNYYEDVSGPNTGETAHGINEVEVVELAALQEAEARVKALEHMHTASHAHEIEVQNLRLQDQLFVAEGQLETAQKNLAHTEWELTAAKSRLHLAEQAREEIAELKAEKIAHLQLIDGQAEEIERLKNPAHNHITRDIKPRGECPSCDQYYAKQDWRNLEEENARLKAALAKISLGHEYSCGVNQGVLCTCRAGIAIKALDGGT